ncbi:hypothetical protein [Deinococcus sp.]|uniref:hypothetical protein n=1 Tax=Deinococcus sp. TaxID=47478 RepID=UPI003C7B7F11
MKPLTVLLTVLASALAPALAASTTLNVGGKAVALDSVVVGGKTYVSLDQLKTALTAAGGSNQLASAEGCINQLLFDGVWRLRVTKVEFKPNPKDGTFWGWTVTTEIRNGYRDVLSFNDTGIGKGISVALKDGNLLGMFTSTQMVDTLFQDIAPAAAVIVPFRFRGPDGASDDQVKNNPPLKFLLPIDLKVQTYHNLKLPYASNPNFRVDLTCSK